MGKIRKFLVGIMFVFLSTGLAGCSLFGAINQHIKKPSPTNGTEDVRKAVNKSNVILGSLMANMTEEEEKDKDIKSTELIKDPSAVTKVKNLVNASDLIWNKYHIQSPALAIIEFTQMAEKFDEETNKEKHCTFMLAESVEQNVVKKDAEGNMLKDEEGNPIYVQDTNTDGTLKVDSEGNPIYKKETVYKEVVIVHIVNEKTVYILIGTKIKEGSENADYFQYELKSGQIKVEDIKKAITTATKEAYDGNQVEETTE